MFKKNALISVFHKDGIDVFAKALRDLGWTVYSSGGTAKFLRDAGLEVIDVATLVGGGAILGHKVVTLSREVHAGLLAYDTAEDQAELERLNIPWLDLVCVDLYPLGDAIRTKGDNPEAVRDMTDIGGPTMLRSAAKGRRIVICDPTDRQRVIDYLVAEGDLPPAERDRLAAKVEFTVAKYALDSARYISGGEYDGFLGRKVEDLKYGENPQQKGAALFSLGTGDPLGISSFRRIDGSPCGYINLTDLHRELGVATRVAKSIVANFPQKGKLYIALAVKHGNVCGAGISYISGLDAIQKMVEGNPLAIFGGCILTNFEIDLEMAQLIRKHQLQEGSPKRVVDVVVAPSITEEAIAKLRRKDGGYRILDNEALLDLQPDTAWQFRYVRDGFIKQPQNPFYLNLEAPSSEVQIVGTLTEQQRLDACIVKAICDESTSNTITAVRDGMLLGNGTCRPSRVSATWGCIREATSCGLSLKGAVLSSDSFFPAGDGPQEAIDAGVAVVITTSGSRADNEVFALFQNAGVALIIIPNTFGRGFAGH